MYHSAWMCVWIFTGIFQTMASCGTIDDVAVSVKLFSIFFNFEHFLQVVVAVLLDKFFQVLKCQVVDWSVLLNLWFVPSSYLIERLCVLPQASQKIYEEKLQQTFNEVKIKYWVSILLHASCNMAFDLYLIFIIWFTFATRTARQQLVNVKQLCSSWTWSSSGLLNV